MPGDETLSSTQFPLPQVGEAGACSASRENGPASLPPRVTPILTAAINDPTMPPPLFRSYARLYAASWRNAYRCTDALDFDAELVPLLGVRPTQARQHLRYLRFAKLLYWESDGANRYVIHFSSQPDFAKPESVVGDVFNNYFNNKSIDIHQQQLKDSEKPDFRKSREVIPAKGKAGQPADGESGRSAGGAARLVQEREGDEAQDGDGAGEGIRGDRSGESVRAGEVARSGENTRLGDGAGAGEDARLGGGVGAGENARLGDGVGAGEDIQPEIYREALSFLERVGVWPDVAVRIANKLVENQRRGHDYLPSLVDVLGWIAYCFGDGEKNKIDQPAAVLAANLKANRRCPEKYRPLPVCSACGFEEGFCECEGEPDYHFPEGFLDFALKHRDGFSQSAEYAEFYGVRPITIWGVCRRCHGFPCQCEED